MPPIPKRKEGTQKRWTFLRDFFVYVPIYDILVSFIPDAPDEGTVEKTIIPLFFTSFRPVFHGSSFFFVFLSIHP